jgi:hypothetical protein
MSWLRPSRDRGKIDAALLLAVEWNAVAAISTAVSVLVAVLVFASQARQLKRSIASATYQDMVRSFDDFSKLIVDSPELHDAISADAPADDEKLRCRAEWAMGIRFDWFESVVIQHRHYKALPETIANHWLGVLEHELTTKPVMRSHWLECREYYHRDLQDEVKRLVPELESLPAPAANL